MKAMPISNWFVGRRDMLARVDRLLVYFGPQPYIVSLTTMLLLFFLLKIASFVSFLKQRGLRGLQKMILSRFAGLFRSRLKSYLNIDKLRNDMEKEVVLAIVGEEESYHHLPKQGLSTDIIEKKLLKWSAYEKKSWQETRQTGAVYHGGEDLLKIQAKAFELFAITNSLHSDMFPFLRKMEAEIVRMTANYFNGGPDTCGMTTSGGTESIFMAVKTFRSWAQKEKGITEPELVFPDTAHAAFMKACILLKVEPVMVFVKENGILEPEDVRRAMSSNTIGIVGSAPNYPNGSLDPVAELGKIAQRYKVCLHVDCCLGSFLITSLEKIGYQLPLYDFRVPGVTTISVDTHKFGYSVKGSSVLLFCSKEMRRNTYIFVPEWTGGVYGTPGLPGSRPGGIMAATWAAMVATGVDGYENNARVIMKEVEVAKAGIESIPEVALVGHPVSSTLTIKSLDPIIKDYAIAEAMKEQGFIMSRMQNPMGCHFTFTYVHRNGGGKQFVDALRKSVGEIIKNPDTYSGKVALYGTAAALPSGLQGAVVSEVVSTYFDIALDFLTPKD